TANTIIIIIAVAVQRHKKHHAPTSSGCNITKTILTILNDPREAFAMALLTLGYSINDHNPKHIQQAYKKLQQLLPNIKVFNTNAIINIYTDQDASIGMSWNGEANIASRGNPNLVYIYPQNGFSIWLDCLAIPKYAPHLKNAYRFINFLEQPKIASLIAIADGYSTPNLAALKYLPKSYRDNPMINPNQKTLQRGHIQLYIGKARKLYQHDWERLKLGG
ncbi:MAG: extracellular solute-binding protein, partial [Gammaproteobacteria bacterium]|nr:extracellular solute-binding protein [Gammaproteobacteria bacterium]